MWAVGLVVVGLVDGAVVGLAEGGVGDWDGAVVGLGATREWVTSKYSTGGGSKHPFRWNAVTGNLEFAKKR